MRKLISLLLISTLMISLAACGENSAKRADLPTAADLMAKSAEASKELKSFTMTSSFVQNIEFEADGQKQTQERNMDITQDIVMNPIQTYFEVKMKIADEQEQVQTIQQYITQDGIYTNAGDGAWTKPSGDQATQFLESLESSTKINQQLTLLEPYANDLKVTEEGNLYVLTSDLSGDIIKELASTLMGQSGTSDAQSLAMLEQMNIEDLKVISMIDKSSSLPTKAVVWITMNKDQGGQKMSIKMQTTSEFTKINELDKIVIPDEVLNSAS